jgi:plasmid stability protein
MRNVTITLEEEVARWVRVEAAKRETSVSLLVGELLRQQMRSEDAYEVAQRQFLAIEPRPLRQSGGPLPSREELHDRPGLR